MKTELLHKYFRGETTEKEESQIVEWTESSAENKERFLKERMLFDITLFSDDSKIQRKPKGHLYLYVTYFFALDGEVMTQPLSLSGRLMQKPVRSCGIQIMNVLLMTVFPVEFSLRLPVERTALPIIYM